MNPRDEHPPRPRPPVVPSVSSRTLQHPSFLPLYLAAGFARQHGGWVNHTVQAITPEEFYYTDPTASWGRRIPNMVTDFGFYDCFQLNTPPPVMSACLAPPNCSDPFGPGPHPTRDLGSPKWKTNPVHLPVQSSRAILQLTQEEDQAITNLLKLHHQEPGPGDETPTEEVCQSSFGDGQHPSQDDFGDQLQEGRYWSEAELEAADTLLSRFSLVEDDRIWAQCLQKTAITPPDPLPHQNNTDLALSTET
ncbi:uncharacterized protein [Paralichthys olivaceus]|uniref:uncharacterized protein n=1 Tax=Paralichthys olivaceus TaxID=8255 RepID=UPI003752D38B